MSINKDLPNYQELFGQLDFKKGKEARSVYSPAAYLADLIQLIDDFFADSDINDRRSDVKNLVLSEESTFDLIPYLDIVNEILENIINVNNNTDNPYDILKNADYPFNLPFDLNDLKIRKYLQFLGVMPTQLYKAFAITDDPDTVTKNHLGISETEYNIVEEESDETKIRASYNLDAADNWESLLALEKFIKTTGFSGLQVRELLFGKLSETAKNNLGKPERTEAKSFFINTGLGGYAALDAEEENLIWITDTNQIPDWQSWFEKLNRFSHIALKLNISFSDLQTILSICCDNELTKNNLQKIAIIKQFHDKFELSYDVACSLLSMEINTRGIGDEPNPQDLFNEIFNNKWADLEKEYIAASPFIPKAYEGYGVFSGTGNILEADHKSYRHRIQKALHISSGDLELIINKFKKYSESDEEFISSIETNIELKGLSLLYKITRIVQLLDTTYEELFDLFDILNHDPVINKFNNFEILAGDAPEELNAYRILDGGDFNSNAWLLQLIFSVVQWAQENDLNFGELNEILNGTLKSEEAEILYTEQQIKQFNNIYQQFKTVLLKPEMFGSGRFDERSANMIYDLVLQDKQLVSHLDTRIINYNPSKAKKIAYNAIRKLGHLRNKDFRNLGLSNKMLDYLYQNLITREYLNIEGVLVEKNYPENMDDFSIATDFPPLQSRIFSFLNNEYLSFTEDEEIELSIFISDLGELGIAEPESKELYDNLIFNGYIDEEGNVLDVDFFGDMENKDKLEFNSNLITLSAAVYEKINQKTKNLEEEELMVNSSWFESLELGDNEIEDLIENLQFNNYIDENKKIVDKKDMLNLDIKEFNLALVFYPSRHKILKAIKEFVGEFKSDYFSFVKEDFKNLAEDTVTELLINKIELEYSDNTFFENTDNLSKFKLGGYFNEGDKQNIFNHIAKIFQNANKYRLTLDQFTELEFNEEDYQELMTELESSDIIIKERTVSAAQIDYFLNINNALHFTVAEFEDYNKDIFFILHNLAKEINEGIEDIFLVLSNSGENQETIIFNALQDITGQPLDILKTVFKEIFANEHTVEAIMGPLLSTVNEKDKITEIPQNHKFNISFQRARQFALLNSKIGLTKKETEVIFNDQGLVGKFSENLMLPEGLDRFDALLENFDDKIYMFKDDKYWTWSMDNYNILEENMSLGTLSESFAGLSSIDAAFMDEKGTAWLISGELYFCREEGKENWARKEKVWGKVDNEFENAEKIKAAFQDKEGKSYLFAENQYVRYSDDFIHVDEGYPKNIKGNWENELELTGLPGNFQDSIDAAFQGIQDKTYLFKNQQFICSDDLSKEMEISSFWGKVKDTFGENQKADAVCALDDKLFVFYGEQVIRYSDSIENEGVYIDEGFPGKLSNLIPVLPEEFRHGVDAAFKGVDGNIHLYKNEHYLSLSSDFSTIMEEAPLAEKWGIVRNNIEAGGNIDASPDASIDASFAGLDGRVYIFSGNQYYRYSGKYFHKADEGYPRTIAGDWGGLSSVNAAFVMDGKTYLFGGVEENDTVTQNYVCYSSNDYSILDEEFPKPIDDNWWNVPFALTESGFDKPDAVFIGKNGNVYLFNGDEFIYFEKNQRWWSEPQKLSVNWDSIPFAKIDAAFTGKDGRTYLFSGKKFIRYSDRHYNKIDDRFPKDIADFWGKVNNNIALTESVAAALVLESREELEVDGEMVDVRTQHTYLFSGNQFYRYKGNDYDNLEEGYPKHLENLRDEPRFANLDIDIKDGIDAAFANQRTVFLFKDGEIHLCSDTKYKLYENLAPQDLFTTFVHEGKFYLEDTNGWKQYSDLEANSLSKQDASPAILRKVPGAFKDNLNAILEGVDGNTYLFKNENCYNVLLEMDYPLKEEWGRLRCNIQTDNHIDSVLEGLDGKIYLFSGSQFVTYTMPKASEQMIIPDYIDTYPDEINEHFPGLTNVDLAYTQEGKTYLFEKADKQGKRKYLCYSTADYSKPDQDEPGSVDFSWWNIPGIYIAEGFDRIDAIISRDDDLFFIREKELIHYNSTKKHWNYPRPAERVLKGLSFNNSNFESITTAFIASNGHAYIFSDDSYVSINGGIVSPTADIKSRWGKMDNNIVEKQKIDAAFVFNKKTYLFSRDQYVRYSGIDYQYIDKGYPKDTLNNLREEECFKHLPDSFETTLENLFEAEKTIDAIVANQRNLYILEQGNVHVTSYELSATYKQDFLGKVRNNIQSNNQVDAAFVNEEGDTILFSGDQYFRYSAKNYQYLDEGYPKLIKDNLMAEEGNGPLPEPFHYDIDAALLGNNGEIYLFKDKHYVGSSQTAMTQNIKDTWAKVDNIFHHPGDQENIALDGLFIAPDGNAYAFKEDQYIRYQNFENEFIDQGFPKAIKDNWGNMPLLFEEGIDGVFVFEGKTYISKADEYIRYTKPEYQQVDPIFPQKFGNRWRKWADYLLTDIKTIFQYSQFLQSYGGSDYSLTDFFGQKGMSKGNPYEMLSGIFGWDIDEIMWLKRNHAFLPDQGELETRFNMEQVSRMYNIFNIADKMGVLPSDIHKEVWKNLYENGGDKEVAATALYKYLGWSNSEKDWSILSRQLHGELNEAKRDALVAYVISKDDDAGNTRDLYGKLLIDLEMSSCAETSRVKEALAALQLYLHRYFVNLELLDIKGEEDEARRKDLRKDWQWMKNYRVWEANRKVFLYPENYIRPELRDTKTPAFKTLENDLMQGELTDSFAQQAYKKYLDEYTEVSRLTIAGGYVYEDPADASDLNLILFGRTKTDPLRYYYRLSGFIGGATNAASWNPWIPVEIQIESKRVYPVYAFGRIFVFWGKVEKTVETSNSTRMTVKIVDDTQTISNNAKTTYTVKIYYSFYDLNKNWKAPQLLDTEINSLSEINDDFELYVENNEKLGTDDHENIIIRCKYQGYRKKAYYLTPELYTIEIAANSIPDYTNIGLQVFRDIFADEEAMSEKRLVLMNTFKNSADGPWFSFDHKGGSFLVKPSALSLGVNQLPKNLADDNDNNLPQWNKVDAAVRLGNRNILFNNESRKFVYSDDLGTEIPIKDRWGHIFTKIRDTGIVDAVLSDGTNNYFFNDDEYLIYSDQYDRTDSSFPSKLDENDSFPNNPISAALHLDGIHYFFQGDQYVTSDDLNNSRTVDSKWNLPIITDSFITAAFVHGNHSYLIGSSEYARYEGAAYTRMETGYPKGNSLFNILEDLACTNNEESYRNITIVATTEKGSEILIYTNQGDYKYSDGLVEETGGSGNLPYASFVVGNTVYNFFSNSLIPTIDHVQQFAMELNRNINASFVGKDNLIYLFSGEEFITVDIAAVTPNMIAEHINEWANPRGNQEKWGHQGWGTSEGNEITAAYNDGTRSFLFKGSEYCAFDNDDNIVGGYPKQITNLLGNNSDWDSIDAAFKGKDDLIYYFNKSQKQFVSSANPNEPKPAGQWGIVSNNITEKGVDSAYRDSVPLGDDKLYLLSGNEIFRYTIAEGEVMDFVDENYPKSYDTGDFENFITASYKLGGKVYLFFENRYMKLDEGEALGQLERYIRDNDGTDKENYINGNWGNLRPELKDGFDASLKTDTDLIFFKGNQYIKYDLPQEGESTSMPYEVGEAVFDIIRLTTGTGHKLNERLFLGGIDLLLNRQTQEINEIPKFDESQSNPSTIKYNDEKIQIVPTGSHLDFSSANGIYYWEIFFHTPYLIAQSFNTAQKFDEAKRWYEFIYDPTESSDYWKFLPFLSIDLQAIIDSGEENLRSLTDISTDLNERLSGVFEQLEPLVTAFQGQSPITAGHREQLEALRNQNGLITELENITFEDEDQAASQQSVIELLGMIAELSVKLSFMQNSVAQIKTYINDPFDPHAIASLRNSAYQKAIVMSYVDNLLNWGDLLFRQYTMESINEARMLYILAYDLLGDKPENMGTKALSEDRSFNELLNPDTDYDFLLYLENSEEGTEDGNLNFSGTVHDSIVNNTYFYIPENSLFLNYWENVEDRLYKIRHCLNILGIKQPLPLFQPSIDPMALVRAASGGGGFSAALGGSQAVIPHYRFTFMIGKVKELIQQLNQFGGDLLAALEKNDSEALIILQTKQEGVILNMQEDIRTAQIGEAQANISYLEESLKGANDRAAHYNTLLENGMSGLESTQLDLVAAGSALMLASSVIKIAAGIAHLTPTGTFGPFSLGTSFGGRNVGNFIKEFGESLETMGDGISMAGDAVGQKAAFERMKEDWMFQKQVADSEIIQIEAHLEGARFMEMVAQYETKVLDKEREHNETVSTFLKDKFTNDSLYQWMSGKLSGLYFQTYKIAFDMARQTEKSYQFERAVKESEVGFVSSPYWDSQRKGLLAGESLSLDVVRMEQAFMKTDARRFEITKSISLLELDPLALLELKTKGVCEFSLTEALFDYDFQGHYCRQVKSVMVNFEIDLGNNKAVFATLTQLSHKTIMEPDAKAVKFLLDPKDKAPLSIRNNWKASQQIALSREADDGMFDAFYSDDRYLHFEGTGAVSTWRLELNGKKGDYSPDDLEDVTISLDYTALRGGDVFANAVRGLLKPYATAILFDFARMFSKEWSGFLGGESNELNVTVGREMFPNMSSGKIMGIYSQFIQAGEAKASFTMNNDNDLVLEQNKYLLTTGLSISKRGSDWTLSFGGDRDALENVLLVLSYMATVK